MEVKLDTNLSGYGGEIIRTLDAMIGHRIMNNPSAYENDRLLYVLSPEERQWASRSPRTLQLIHQETGSLLVSVNQLRTLERVAARDESLGIRGGGSGFNGLQSGFHETKTRLREITESYFATRDHFQHASQHGLAYFQPLTSQPPATDINIPQFYQALRQRIGFLQASELEQAISRFHAVSSIHEKECLTQTVQLMHDLGRMTKDISHRWNDPPNGKLTSYGDPLLNLHQSLGQIVQEQRTLWQQQQGNQIRYSGHSPAGRVFFDR